MKTPMVFLRDDDVWERDDTFRELFDLLIAKDIAVVYGIIPARLEDGMVRFLRQAKSKYPHLLDIMQHGFSHENYALSGEAKYEFGPGRTYQQQYNDVSRGMQIMQKRFGRLWTPGFIPPYHGYDKATFKVMDKLKVPLFSAGKKVLVPANFIDCPAQVSLNEYDKSSVPLPFDLRSMLTRTLKALESGKIIGLLYHHRAIRTKADLAALKAFLLGVARWRDEGKLRLVLFSDLLRSELPSLKTSETKELG